MARIDVLIVNRGEAATLAGTADPDVAARRLLDQGPGAVIVTLGVDGLICARHGEALLTQGAPAVRVISTHGAGDSFVGALAAVLTQGTALSDALAFAQGMAALKVATPPDARAAITPGAVRAFCASL